MKRTIVKTVEELNKFLETFNKEAFSLDCETTDLLFHKQEVICMTICDGQSSAYIPFKKELFEVMGKLKPYILVGHNLIFDLKALSKCGLYYPDSEYFDTMVAYHLINENDNKGLKYLAKKLLGKDMVEYNSIATEKPHSKRFMEYAIEDAEATWELAMYLKPLLEEEGVLRLFREIEMPFLKVLLKMELTGVLVDQKKLKNTTIEVEEAVSSMEMQLLDLIGEKYQMQMNLVDGKMKIISNINFNSGQQLEEIMFKRLGLQSVGTTKSGRAKTGKEAINKLKDQSEFVKLLEKYKIAQKIYNAFLIPLPGYVDDHSVLHPNFNDAGTVTGRLSCREPNLQQLPKSKEQFPVDVRGFFIARPGKSMIACDYSQQELRIMAHLSKDENLIDTILNDGDIHLINANNVFGLGIPREKLFASHPEFEAIKKKHKVMRDKGKIFSFGIAYGMGTHKLSRDFNVSMDEAQILLDNFFKGFPGLQKAIETVHYNVQERRFVTTMFGRKRRFELNPWGKIDDKALRQSFNFLIQSCGADLIRLACIKLQKYSEEHPEYGLNLLLTVHDECLMECNMVYVDKVAKDAEQIFESCAKLVVPLKAEAGIGLSYSDTK